MFDWTEKIQAHWRTPVHWQYVYMILISIFCFHSSLWICSYQSNQSSASSLLLSCSFQSSYFQASTFSRSKKLKNIITNNFKMLTSRLQYFLYKKKLSCSQKMSEICFKEIQIVLPIHSQEIDNRSRLRSTDNFRSLHSPRLLSSIKLKVKCIAWNWALFDFKLKKVVIQIMIIQSFTWFSPNAAEIFDLLNLFTSSHKTCLKNKVGSSSLGA